MNTKFDVVIVKNLSWWAFLSPLIMWVENVPGSHCAIIQYDELETWVYESTWPHGKRVRLEEFLIGYKIVWRKSFVLDNINSQVSEWLLDNLADYSELELFTNGISFLNKWIKQKISIYPVNGRRSSVCSEYVGQFMVKWLGFRPNEDLDYFTVGDVICAAKHLKEIN